MCYYIGIEDLVANALIEIMAKSKRRFLSYEEIEKYGSRVIEVLSEQGEKAVLILSRENTTALLRNYSEFFEEKNEDCLRGIALREGKESDDLIEQFRGYLSLDVLLAFVNRKSVQALGV